MRSIATNVVLGAAAGAAGTWVMDRLTTVMYERESKKAREQENAARGDRTAYEIAADRIASATGRTLTKDERSRLGSAIHWSLGIGAGAMYGALRNRMPAVVGSGFLYGMAFFLLADELALTLLGLTPPPQKFPWQTHARGLAGHLLLGAALEAPFDLADLRDAQHQLREML